MTPFDVRPQASPPAPAHEAADALTAVVHSATAVARAELRLVKAETKAWLTRVGLGLLLAWLSALLLQVFVLLLALTPVLAAEHGGVAVGAMLLLALVPVLATGGFAWREFTRLKESRNGNDEQHDH